MYDLPMIVARLDSVVLALCWTEERSTKDYEHGAELFEAEERKTRQLAEAALVAKRKASWCGSRFCAKHQSDQRADVIVAKRTNEPNPKQSTSKTL